MFRLRDYQLQAIQQTYDNIALGKTRVKVCLPPGAGKGDILCNFIIDFYKQGKTVLFVAHKTNLVSSENAIADRLRSTYKFDDFGFYLAGKKTAIKRVMLGTNKTANNRKIQNIDVMIIDESHRTKAPEYIDLITKVSPKILIGLTATPFRTKKGESFEDMYDVIVNPISTRKLIARKFLVPYKIICPKVDVDFSGIKIKHSVSGEADFDQTELFKRYDNDRVYQTVIDKWKEHGENRPTVVFCTNDKRHVNNTVEWFVRNGIKAEGITSDTTTEQQKQTMKNFADGHIKILVNIGMISEGISIDRTSCIMFVCATASLVRWVQASARGNRALWNSDYTDWLKSGGNYVKKDCILIDLGMNVSRPGLGSPEDYDLMGFDLTGKPKSNGTAPMKSCKKCDFANHASARFCKNCGNKFEITIKDEKVYADEVEMYEVDKMDLFIDKILNSSANAIKERFKVVHRPDLLRITAEIKGWGIDWAAFAAKTYGYTTLDPKTQAAQIFELLDQEEQDSGMWVYREYLKQKYVQKRH